MTTRPHDYASDEQRLYAKWLDRGTRFGFVVLVATFFVYVLGLLPAHVPVAELPKYWSLPVAEYVAATGAPSGWGWVRYIGEGDYLNFVGIGILAFVTVVCYAIVFPTFLRKGDRVYAAIILAEIIVLLVAAAGLVGVGH
ncbi:MAG: hypothetical protein MUF79_08200 [Burkholderiales bacterium]|jgi:hypothetical protein|nr:hypothetical protein [Burkholderiales bacterium]